MFGVLLYKRKLFFQAHSFSVCAVFNCHRSLLSTLTRQYIRLSLYWLQYTILLSFSIGEEA